jgi:protein-S-isoprenylcysteine O-methyltransferase Ste14
VAATYLQGSHPAAVVLLVSVAAFAAGEFGQRLVGRRGARNVDLLGEFVFRLVFVAGIVALPLCRSVLPGAVLPGRAVPFFAGVIVGWLGLLLRWWCFVTLGRYFTDVLKTSADQEVVDRGPYRVLRHPSYTGLLLALIGCGLMIGNWAGVAGSFVLVLVALMYRIGIEERALTAALGDAYRSFAAGRARLVPFVW